MAKTEENKTEKSDRNAFNMFKRIIRLDQLLASGVYPNLDYLLKDEGMEKASRATIYRIIERMKFELNAPIILDKEKGGYCYATKTFRLPVYLLTEKQMESISFFEDYVKNLKGNPMYENFQSVLHLIKKTTLKNPLDRPYDPYGDFADYDSSEAVKLDWNVNQHYIILGDSRGGVEEDTWNNIEKAIKEHRCITFDYDWPLSKYSHRHGVGKVAPYQVVCSGNKWYLWGWNYEKDAFQLFMMDRILGVELMFDRFKLPEKFDYRECGSGEMHMDLMRIKPINKTILLETSKTAEELNAECRTTRVRFSDYEAGKVKAEIHCNEKALDFIMDEIKQLIRPEKIGNFQGKEKKNNKQGKNMGKYTNEKIKEIIADISKIPVNKPEEIYGNMDEWTTRFTWESVKAVLETIPMEKHFEFISSLFVMTVFHQAVFTYFYGLDKHFAKQPGEYTKYRSRYQFPEFGWCGMEGTRHEDVWDLFTYALNDNVISLEDLNTRGNEVAELFKAWSEFLIEDCQLEITYGKLIETLRTDYTLDVRLKVRNQQRKDFPSEYVSAMEKVIRKMLEKPDSIDLIRSKHRTDLDYLKDK